VGFVAPGSNLNVSCDLEASLKLFEKSVLWRVNGKPTLEDLEFELFPRSKRVEAS
jgi:hypothetical protein